MSTIENCKVHDYPHCWKCSQDRIFDLERQLAEALLCGIFCRDGCEKDKKLEAVRKFAKTGCADIERDGILAILGEKGT